MWDIFNLRGEIRSEILSPFVHCWWRIMHKPIRNRNDPGAQQPRAIFLIVRISSQLWRCGRPADLRVFQRKREGESRALTHQSRSRATIQPFLPLDSNVVIISLSGLITSLNYCAWHWEALHSNQHLVFFYLLECPFKGALHEEEEN